MKGRFVNTTVCILSLLLVCQSMAKPQRSKCDEEDESDPNYQVSSKSKNTNVQEINNEKIVTDIITTVLTRRDSSGNDCSKGSSRTQQQTGMETQHNLQENLVVAEVDSDLGLEDTSPVDELETLHIIDGNKNTGVKKQHGEQEQHSKHQSSHHIKTHHTSGEQHSKHQTSHHSKKHHTKHTSSSSKHHHKKHQTHTVKRTHHIHKTKHTHRQADASSPVTPITQRIITRSEQNVSLECYYIMTKGSRKKTLTIFYTFYHGSRMATNSSYKIPLISGSRNEVAQMFERYRMKLEKRYRLTDRYSVEEYSYILRPPGKITIFYKSTKEGKVVDEKVKTYPISNADIKSIDEIIRRHKGHNDDNSNHSVPSHKYSYTTHRGVIVGKDVEYVEKLTYFRHWQGLTTIFHKLYNTDGRLIYREPHTTLVRGRDQGAINRYFRTIIDRAHNGTVDKEGEILGNVPLEERIVYKRDDEEMKVKYRLYKHGNIVQKKGQAFAAVANSQLAIDNTLNYFIDHIHVHRKNFDDTQELQEDEDEMNEKMEKEIEEEESEYKEKFSYDTGYTEVIGSPLKFKEVFSYDLGDGEIILTFKLINTNRRVVFSETKTYPLENDDQGEIDQIVKEFIKRIHHGVNEVNSEGENVESLSSFPESEKLHYEVGSDDIKAKYERYRYEKLIETVIKTFPTPVKTQRAYDKILKDFMETNHRNREDMYVLFHKNNY